MITDERAAELKNLSRDFQDITLSERQLCDLELIATDAYYPLKSFLGFADYEAVLGRMRLANDEPWPMPICLDVPEARGKSLKPGQRVGLRDQEGFLLAVMHIEDIWRADKAREARLVYGTDDPDHPGVHHLFHKTADYYIGGAVELLNLPTHFDFKQLRLSPAEVRGMFKKLGWHRIAGFQTRHPLHRPQFEMTLEAMRRVRANLLLLPTVGMGLPGDFDYYTRVRCCREILKYYPQDSVMLSLLPLSHRMAGPREAVWQAIISRNYGCTHFIMGPDHGSPRALNGGKRFYQSDDAKYLARSWVERIGIEVIAFEEMVYLQSEDKFRPLDQVRPGAEYCSMSPNEIRDRIRTGNAIPIWATFPETAKELMKAYPLPRNQGFTVFLTGLSGAGKSTIAKVLYGRLMEMGDRPVTLLDGDIVRQHLSSELGFSKEHRDINIRRIGYVASEIAKNRGIAICAPIAPYSRTRREVRDMNEQHGGFIEVHVATPLEECERRDRKGMYAKARAGLIKGFTGIDDPYEAPENPEVRIDTTNMTPDEAAHEVLLMLRQKGYV